MSSPAAEFTPKRPEDAEFIATWLRALFAKLKLSRRGKITVDLINTDTKPTIRVTRRG